MNQREAQSEAYEPQGVEIIPIEESQDRCPQCGVGPDCLQWLETESFDSGVAKNFQCRRCDCRFHEWFAYQHSIID